MKTNWITFYSYKGGVGRSMALANVAAELASSGRCVVMIDFDLEAPGLDSFEEYSQKGAPGVVEYIDEFRRSKITPDIEKFVHRCPLKLEAPGQMWLMPSGRKDDAYAERLHRMDWSFFYETGIAEPFIANWKKAIERAFKPDYVLIDSRTGLTDVGGVCTLHFPDIVVLLFALNRQNLFGTAGVRRAIAQTQRREPIQIITVASPLPNLAREAGSPLDLRLKEAQRVLETKINAVISYFPSVVLEESLWTLNKEFPQPKIVEDYGNLAEQIISRLRDGFDFLLRRARYILEKQDEVAAESVIKALQGEYGDRALSYRMIARLERMRHDREASLRALETALSIDPTDQSSFEAVTRQYRAMRRFKELRTTIEAVHERIRASDVSHEVLIPIAESYMQLGEYKKALETYLEANDLADSAKMTLILKFNVAEARRRLTREIHSLDWLSVLELVEIPTATVIGDDINTIEWTANRLQALHIAFALTGRIRKASDCLDKALTVAATMNDATTIFSVSDYVEVPVSDFIKTTESMRTALKRGELWDGMTLPSELDEVRATE